jgi:hypothetical protein
VIIPAIGIVIDDDHRGVFPEGALLQGIDRIDQEGLLVERIGISRVPVLALMTSSPR